MVQKSSLRSFYLQILNKGLNIFHITLSRSRPTWSTNIRNQILYLIWYGCSHSRNKMGQLQNSLILQLHQTHSAIFQRTCFYPSPPQPWIYDFPLAHLSPIYQASSPLLISHEKLRMLSPIKDLCSGSPYTPLFMKVGS